MIINTHRQTKAHVRNLILVHCIDGPVGGWAVVPALLISGIDFQEEGGEGKVIAVELERFNLVDAIHCALVRAVGGHVPFSYLADKVWVGVRLGAISGPVIN